MLLSLLFFVVSPHTPKHTHKQWPVTTIIPLSPVVAQAAVSFAPSPSLPLSNARHPDGDEEGNGNGINDGDCNKDTRTKAARGMIMATKRAKERARVARWMAMAARGMATATRVAGDKKIDGDGSKENIGDWQQQHGQWLQQRGWWAFDGGNNGDGAKDMAACAMTGERGMMVAMGHGLCVCFGVCGETTKN